MEKRLKESLHKSSKTSKARSQDLRKDAEIATLIVHAVYNKQTISPILQGTERNSF